MASAAKKQHRIKEPVRARPRPRRPASSRPSSSSRSSRTVEDPLAEWTRRRGARPQGRRRRSARRSISRSRPRASAASPRSRPSRCSTSASARPSARRSTTSTSTASARSSTAPSSASSAATSSSTSARTEAVVPRTEQSRHERYSQGERIRGVIVDVHKQPKGPQIVLSRTDPRLLVKLFEMEVPEIYDGTVVIKTAVRAPGERAKVAVYSRERDVDPVGACVGMKGSRVQSIIRELRGEKIDIIEYSDDLVTFAQSALAPAKITRVSVHAPRRGAAPRRHRRGRAALARDRQARPERAPRLRADRLQDRHQERVRRQGRGGRRAGPHAPGRDEPAAKAPTLDWSDAPGQRGGGGPSGRRRARFGRHAARGHARSGCRRSTASTPPRPSRCASGPRASAPPRRRRVSISARSARARSPPGPRARPWATRTSWRP